MTHKIGNVDNSNGRHAHINLIAMLRHVCGGFGDIGTIGGARAGDGTLSGLHASPTALTETWTLTCTAVAGDGGIFAVVGSVSGAMSSATVGSVYDNGMLSFIITDGAVDFELGDVFTVPVARGAASAAGDAWEVLEYVNTGSDASLILKGKGYSGAEEIFVGFSEYFSTTSDYYNLVVWGFTGYVPGNTMATQPGARWSAVPCHNQRVDYWLSLTAQRIACAMKIGTPVYESFYVGKSLPYARPSQFPYPLVVAGMLAANTAPATRYSDTAHSMPYKGKRSNLALRNNAGAWLEVECYPWNNDVIAGITYQARDTGGNYPLLPIILSDASGVYGELEGVFYVPGFNNVVENTLEIDGKNYVVIEDVYRTGFADYYALRMD